MLSLATATPTTTARSATGDYLHRYQRPLDGGHRPSQRIGKDSSSTVQYCFGGIGTSAGELNSSTGTGFGRDVENAGITAWNSTQTDDAKQCNWHWKQGTGEGATPQQQAGAPGTQS